MSEIVVSGHARKIPLIGSAGVHIAVQKKANKAASVAVIMDIKAMEPSAILSTLITTNLNEVPLINEVKIDMLLEYSNSDIDQITNEDLSLVLKKYTTSVAVSKGTKLKMIIPIRDVLKKKGILNSIVKDTYVQAYVTETKVEFKFPENNLLDLSNMLNALIPKIPESLFRKVLVNPPAVKIASFDVTLKTKDVAISIVAPQKFMLGHNLFEVDTARFELGHRDGQAWEFTMTAQKKIGGSMMDLGVKKTVDSYELTGTYLVDLKISFVVFILSMCTFLLLIFQNTKNG